MREKNKNTLHLNFVSVVPREGPCIVRLFFFCLSLRQVVFVDVKPDNFMLGAAGPRAGRVVIADFGVAEKFVDAKGAHRAEGSGGPAGTPDYQSLAVHAGGTPSRRDDCEALGYLLCELVLGGAARGARLPWQDAPSHAAGLAAKQVRTGEKGALGGGGPCQPCRGEKRRQRPLCRG